MSDILFIINPISGKGKKKEIAEMLLSRSCNVIFTEYAGHAESIARNATQRIVVAVGGDGTVNEVARGLVGTDKILGILPCGSGDGLALSLGISRDPRTALETIFAGKSAPLDCATIDSKPFFSVCGVGFDALISKKFASGHTRGLITYIKECVSSWFSYVPQEYSLDIDGVIVKRRALLVTVGNSNQWGNGAKITPMADSGDSMLDVALVEPFHTWEVPYMAMLLFRGNLSKSTKVHYYKGRSIKIHRPTDGPVHYDGDYVEGTSTVSVELLPEKIRVIVP